MEIQTAVRADHWAQYEGQGVASNPEWRADRASPPAQKRGAAQTVIWSGGWEWIEPGRGAPGQEPLAPVDRSDQRPDADRQGCSGLPNPSHPGDGGSCRPNV